jgi:hypothetical protein
MEDGVHGLCGGNPPSTSLGPSLGKRASPRTPLRELLNGVRPPPKRRWPNAFSPRAARLAWRRRPGLVLERADLTQSSRASREENQTTEARRGGQKGAAARDSVLAAPRSQLAAFLSSSSSSKQMIARRGRRQERPPSDPSDPSDRSDLSDLPQPRRRDAALLRPCCPRARHLCGAAAFACPARTRPRSRRRPRPRNRCSHAEDAERNARPLTRRTGPTCPVFLSRAAGTPPCFAPAAPVPVICVAQPPRLRSPRSGRRNKAHGEASVPGRGTVGQEQHHTPAREAGGGAVRTPMAGTDAPRRAPSPASGAGKKRKRGGRVRQWSSPGSCEPATLCAAVVAATWEAVPVSRAITEGAARMAHLAPGGGAQT